MKKILIRVYEFLEEYTVLEILVIVICVAVFCMPWRWSLDRSSELVHDIKALSDEYWKDAEKIGDHVFGRGKEMYLIDEENWKLLAGPFAVIYYEDFDLEDEYWSYRIARYENSDGKIGYVRGDGTIVTEAIYSKGSPFHEGFAAVQDGQGNKYRINTQGQIVS